MSSQVSYNYCSEDSWLNRVADDFDEVDFSVSHEDSGEPTLDVGSKLDHTGSNNNKAHGISAAIAPLDESRGLPQKTQNHTNPPSGVTAHLDASFDSDVSKTILNSTKVNKPSSTAVQHQKPAQAPLPQQRGPGHVLKHQAQLQSHRPHTDVNGDNRALGAPGPQLASLKGLQDAHNAVSSATSLNSMSVAMELEPPVGFFTARAAETIQSSTGLPSKSASFNPHLESPSIRKTVGVDHSKTKPVGKDVIGASPSHILSPAMRPNIVHPQVEKPRRIGMPLSTNNIIPNRGSYRPPQMKRPAEEDAEP